VEVGILPAARGGGEGPSRRHAIEVGGPLGGTRWWWGPRTRTRGGGGRPSRRRAVEVQAGGSVSCFRWGRTKKVISVGFVRGRWAVQLDGSVDQVVRDGSVCLFGGGSRIAILEPLLRGYIYIYISPSPSPSRYLGKNPK
jgi:hypothetical protein